MKRILLCIVVLCATQVFAADVDGVPGVPASEGRNYLGASGRASIFFENIRKFSIDQLVKCFTDRVDEVIQKTKAQWDEDEEKTEALAKKVVEEPTKENFFELITSYDNFLEVVLKDSVCSYRVFAMLDYLRNTIEPSKEMRCKTIHCHLQNSMRKNFAIANYLYRHIVMFANELSQKPELFIRDILNGKDPTLIRDGVIWCTSDWQEKKDEIERDSGTSYSLYMEFLTTIYTREKIGHSIGERHILGCIDGEDYDFIVDGVDGRELYRGVETQPGSQKFCRVSFPLRMDMFFKHASSEVPTFWCPPDPNLPVANSDIGGWKLHVTATPLSAAKVARVVVPYLLSKNVKFKILPTADVVCRFYFNARFGSWYSQYGKFITIYPASGEKGAEIANWLDVELSNRSLFIRRDFVSCSGEFSIGKSGALFTRYVPHYGRDIVSEQLDIGCQRRVPLIPESHLDVAAESMPMPILRYCGVQFMKSIFSGLMRDLGLVVSDDGVHITDPAALAPDSGRGTDFLMQTVKRLK
ncbi:MAG: hypothetical protein LBB21_03715 [Holosporaceae bacterium]|jgi:hypothetical protein|nr:hypothetical protein [Holosporaceae bacterium]